MSPADAAKAVRRRLASELEDDCGIIERLADAVQKLSIPVADEWMRSLALAFELERFYTAVESTLIRVLRTIDGEAPGGGSWHQEVLRAACVEVAETRPAVISRELGDELRELLKLRHLARHGYDVEPNLTRLQEHIDRVARIRGPLFEQLRSLIDKLRE